MLKKPAWDFNHFVEDPRAPQGRRWGFATLMQSLFCGFLTNRRSLRGVERQSELLCAARIPDSTLYDLLAQFDETDEAGLRRQLHAQVKSAWRSKSLEPMGLPCGVAAVDNKTLWSGKVEAAKDPAAQVVHPQNRPPYATLRTVRTVLISAASKPAIDQAIIPAETNEGGCFSQVFPVLEANYGALIEVYSVDAGFCSLRNLNLIAAAQKGYIAALKDNQPTLCAEAERLLGAQRVPEYSTAWECYQGKRVRYHLYRTKELAGYLDWTHLEQVWRVEKEIKHEATGVIEREQHYYLTNLPWGRFTAAQILRVVRAHWGIENNCNWTLDVIWDEDSKVWCGQGRAIRLLGLLRLMAYNLVAHLRCRYLEQRGARAAVKRGWQAWCELLVQVLVQLGGDACGRLGLKDA
jgi:predicted transposase YbfD/YdcC